MILFRELIIRSKPSKPDARHTARLCGGLFPTCQARRDALAVHDDQCAYDFRIRLSYTTIEYILKQFIYVSYI